MKIRFTWLCPWRHLNELIMPWSEDSLAYEIDLAMENLIEPVENDPNDTLAYRPRKWFCRHCHLKGLRNPNWEVIDDPHADYLNSRLKPRNQVKSSKAIYWW